MKATHYEAWPEKHDAKVTYSDGRTDRIAVQAPARFLIVPRWEWPMLRSAGSVFQRQRLYRDTFERETKVYPDGFHGPFESWVTMTEDGRMFEISYRQTEEQR